MSSYMIDLGPLAAELTGVDGEGVARIAGSRFPSPSPGGSTCASACLWARAHIPSSLIYV